MRTKFIAVAAVAIIGTGAAMHMNGGKFVCPLGVMIHHIKQSKQQPLTAKVDSHEQAKLKAGENTTPVR